MSIILGYNKGIEYNKGSKISKQIVQEINDDAYQQQDLLFEM